MPEDRLPASGRLLDGRHVLPVRVYYEDTDAIGIVYHANYLKWADRARTEMMRMLGADHWRLLREDGVAFAVRRCTIDYAAPARLDDALEVHSRIVDIRGASLEFEQIVHRVAAGAAGVAGDGEGRSEGPETGSAGMPANLVRLSLTLFCLNRAGRPVRLPNAVKAVVSGLGAK
jgi:acyl-CoA thioester hydrolase